MNFKKQKHLILFLIPTLGVVVFFNSITPFFVYDDIPLVVNNHNIKDFSYFKNIFNWLYIHNRPFAFFTLAINYKLSGLLAESYHMVNIALHIIASISAYLLSLKLVSSLPKNNILNIKQVEFSFIVSLIFLLHPLQTQPVNYIIQRMTILSAIGYMMGMFYYINGRNNMNYKTNLNKVIFNFILSLFFFLLGILSKQNVASFPLMILFFEILIFGLKTKNQKRLVLGVLMIFMFLIVYFISFSPVLVDAPNIPRISYLLSQLKVFTIYLRLFFLNKTLNLDHDVSLIYSFGANVIFYLLFLISYIYLAIISRKKNILYSFGLIWVLIALSVESSIIPIRDIIAEHRMYLPVFGLALVISLLFFELRNSVIRITISTTLLIILGVLSFNRNKVWESPLSIWTDAKNKSPNIARPYLGIGAAYMAEGKYDIASKAFESVLKYDSLNIEALNNLGQLNFLNGNQDKAIFFYQLALSLVPNDPITLLNIGQAWEHLGSYKQALKYFKKSEKFQPGNQLVHYNIGNIFLNTDNFQKAIKSYNESLRLGGEDKDLYFNLANCYYQIKDWDRAEKNYEKALLKDSLNISVLINLGNNYFQMGNLSKAEDFYKKVLNLEPGNKLARKNLYLIK